MSTSQRAHNDYTIGWICPLEVEQIAAVEMLDEEHPYLSQPITDNNSYTLGSIQNHNVVIAGLPTTGNCSTATVVAHMRSTFPRIRFALLVGIGGGVPKQTDAGHIRLGHVVVSSGAIQYDHGKAKVGEFRSTGSLASPPNVLLNAAQKLAVARARAKKDPLQAHLQRIDTTTRGLRRYKYPGRAKDDLYQSDYPHADRSLTCQQCCDASKKVIRKTTDDEEDDIDEDNDEWVEIHRGTIASGELVIRDGRLRDELAKQHNILCFEMEAAGALNDFPCLVIRGVSDYSDSHKNDKWHGYAAATAAAYARELFFYMPIDEVAHCKIAESDIQQLMQNTRDIAFSSRRTSTTVEDIAIQAVLSKLPWADGSTYDSFEESDDLNPLCLENTRVELLKEISTWIADPQGKTLFWLNGMAGTGKSTISRTLAERLKQKNQLGANFFFQVGQGDCGSAKRFITTIVSQMARSFPVLIPHIKKVLEIEDPHISGKALGEQFEKLLFQPLLAVKEQITTPIVIVIDALDECRPHYHVTTILSLFSKLRDLHPLQIRAFLTSRPEQESRSGFEEITQSGYQDIILHQIPTSVITHDIEVFFRYRFDLIRSRNKHDLDADWPGEYVLSALIAKAQPLFIFAATVCRFVGDSRQDPKIRLQSVLDNRDDQAYDKVHNTYKPILDSLVGRFTTSEYSEAMENLRRIVGPIVVLYKPLSVNSLAKLLAYEVRTVKRTLDGLHSLLNIPKDLDIPVRTLHLSFVDFLLDKKRRNMHRFWLDTEELHEELAGTCLKLLSTDCSLKQDICGIKIPGTLRIDIDTSLINCHLSPEIQYACRYWIAHLEKVKSNIGNFEDSVCKFLKQRFLFWFEALVLIGRAWEVSTMISTLSTSFSDSSDSELKTTIYDARRFVMANSYIADIAPLQLYSSCLVFSPRQSITRINFSKCIPAWLKQLPAVLDRWGITLQIFEGHLNCVNTVAFSSSGILASGSDDKTIKLWNIVSGELQQTLKGHSGYVNSIAFSPEDVLASGSDDKTIKLWNTISGELRQTLEGHSGGVNVVAFSSNGILASGSYDRTIKLWNTTSEELRQTLKGHSDYVNSIAFSPDGKILASGSSDKTIKLWNTISGELQQTLRAHSERVRTLAFSSEGILASGSDDKTIKLWNTTSGELKQTLKGHSDYVNSIAFSPDGKILASGSKHATIKLWNTVSGELQQTFGSHLDSVQALAFLSDGKTLASGSNDSTIQLRDLGSRLRELGLQQAVNGHSGQIHTLVFSSDGKILACGSGDKTIKLWDVTTGTRRLQQTLHGHSNLVCSLAFSPDSKILASGSYDTTVKLWDVATGSGRLQQTLRDHSDSVCSLAFSLDCKMLASSSGDKTIKLWDVASGQLRQTIYTDRVAHKLSFHRSLPQIESGLDSFQIQQDIAPIQLQDIACIQSQDVKHIKFRYKDNWLVGDGKKLLWLPSDYRTDCWGQFHERIALGFYLGRVVFLEISSEELDQAGLL